MAKSTKTKTMAVAAPEKPKTANIRHDQSLEHKLPTLMSVAAFSEFKDVKPQSVYLAITNKRIIPVVVGTERDLYIDSELYKTFQFKVFAPGKYPRKKVTHKD